MELALDVNVIWQLIFGLFVVNLVAAFARVVLVAAACGGLRIYAPTTGRAAMRRVEAKALEAAAVMAEAEAVVAAEQLRLLSGGT
jgi:hypothetical protein